MAVGSSLSSFQSGQAWVQVNWDDVALDMISVVYQNATQLRAIVEIAEGNRADTFEVLPGAGMPTPVTQAIPKNRYTYSLNAKGDLAPNFTSTFTFKP